MPKCLTFVHTGPPCRLRDHGLTSHGWFVSDSSALAPSGMTFDSLPVAKLLTVREPMIHMPYCVVRRNLGGSLCCGMDILAIKTGVSMGLGPKICKIPTPLVVAGQTAGVQSIHGDLWAFQLHPHNVCFVIVKLVQGHGRSIIPPVW